MSTKTTFTKTLKVELLSDGRHWKLLDSFEYYFYDNDEKHIIEVPAGYITDFASIPRCFHSFISYKDVFNKAAVVHDYLCDTNGYDGKYSKKEVDKIYYDAQLVLYINPINAKIYHRFASWFGTVNYYDWNLKVKS